MDIKKSFGKKLKEKRLKLNLTQEQLSEQIGISPKSLSQIELGNNFISAEKLEDLCNALELPPKALFDFETESSANILDFVNTKLKNNRSLLEKIYKIISIIE